MQDALSQPQDQLDRVNQDDDEIQFAEETESTQPATSWKILIVDDEVEVHEVTKLALSDVTFDGKSIVFISAYSAESAKVMMQAHPDIAIIFLDVVMETDSAGLEFIDYVRNELGNSMVRIILRTGQPGQAPENRVAVDYGIDDYKTKTELTSRKLLITVVTALRAFATLTHLAEISQQLQLELAKQRTTGTALSLSEHQEHEKVHQLEKSLQPLQQQSSQSNQLNKIETLNHLVREIAHDVVNSPNQAGALHTMAIVTRIARMVLRITDDHSTKLGISQSKLAVLVYLSSDPHGYASPSELAKQCGVSRAAMTGLLDGLEHDGYVARDSDPSDRRALMVKLTPTGQQFLDWIAPQEQQPISDVMGSLEATDHQNLIDLIMKVIQVLDE